MPRARRPLCRPGTVPPPAKLAGFSTVVVLGLILIAGAFLLRRRWAAAEVAPRSARPA